MASAWNLMRGTVTCTFTGPFPERLINLCAQEGVTFWGLEWLEEDTIRLTTRLSQVKKMEKLAQRVGCQGCRERRAGLPWFLARFRRRYAFLVGLTLSLGAVLLLSRFVLVVEVQGNDRVPAGTILMQLRTLGLRPGVYGPSLDRGQLAQDALRELKDLSWMSVNLQGTRAVVLVREVVPMPPIQEEEGFYHIVAQADGVVLEAVPERGDSLVRPGDVVAKGDVLLSGVVAVEPPMNHSVPVRYFTTRAKGEVWARTWRTLTAALPLEMEVKEYTGRDRTRLSLEFFGACIPLYRDGAPPGRNWAGEERTLRPRLPGVGGLPLALHLQRWAEYRPVSRSADLEGGQQLLEGQLEARLAQLIGEEGEVLSRSYAARVDGGMLRVTLLAECREEIGEEHPAPDSDIPPAELLLPE